jgi:16S rRNA processing protein RimM
MTARVLIAQIGAAHGVRGEVRLKAFTEDPMSVARYGAF